LWSAAIVTHHATWPAGEMNEHTPAILARDRIDAWLDPQPADKDAAVQVITGIDVPVLQARAVSTAVNKTGRGTPRP
jgi:putative SOS response-associated peptidase YedK